MTTKIRIAKRFELMNLPMKGIRSSALKISVYLMIRGHHYEEKHGQMLADKGYALECAEGYCSFPCDE